MASFTSTKFDPNIRVIFDELASGDNINSQVKSEIEKLDQAAKTIRTDEKDKRSPVDVLRPQIDVLRGSIENIRMLTVSAIGGELDEIRQAWEQDRSGNPSRELAQIRRSENKFKGMSNEEADELAISYASDAADLDYCELNELKGRLRAQGSGAELKTLETGIKERRGNFPWLQAPEASKLADYRDNLASMQRDQLLITSDEVGQLVTTIDQLIDFAGELSE
jgi:signal transduction histidine kinase